MAAEPAAETGHVAADAAAHGEAGSAFPPFDPTTFASQLVWFAISFVVLYFILSRLVLPRIGAVLARRASAISGDLEQAAKKSAAAEQARAGMEKAIAKARADARAMVEKARAEVQAKLGAEQEAAGARLETRIHAAEAQVNAARAKALADVPAIAEALARDIADKLAGARA